MVNSQQMCWEKICWMLLEWEERYRRKNGKNWRFRDTITVYKKEILPASIFIDMKDLVYDSNGRKRRDGDPGTESEMTFDE